MKSYFCNRFYFFGFRNRLFRFLAFFGSMYWKSVAHKKIIDFVNFGSKIGSVISLNLPVFVAIANVFGRSAIFNTFHLRFSFIAIQFTNKSRAKNFWVTSIVNEIWRNCFCENFNFRRLTFLKDKIVNKNCEKAKDGHEYESYHE